jgi:hypothetical protein
VSTTCHPLPPFSGCLLLRHLSTTCPQLVDVPHVRTSPRRSALCDFYDRKEIISTLSPRYAIPRGGYDPMVLPWLGSNGLDLLPYSSVHPVVPLARHVLWLCTMLLHHTPSLENLHELLFMSSCMVCPCF